jgi:hypothetical protein
MQNLRCTEIIRVRGKSLLRAEFFNRLLGKTALNATLHRSDESSERDSTRQPRHGCHPSRVRSSAVQTLVRNCEDNPAASSAIVRQSPKRISEKKLQFHHVLLLCTFARVPARAFLFNLI